MFIDHEIIQSIGKQKHKKLFEFASLETNYNMSQWTSIQN